MAEIIDGSGLASQIRDVAVEDLLGRKAVRLEEGQIRASVAIGLSASPEQPARSAALSFCRQIGDSTLPAIVGIRDCRIAFIRDRTGDAQSFP